MHAFSRTTSSSVSVGAVTVYTVAFTDGSTLRPSTDAVPQMPRSGTRIVTVPPPRSARTAGRRWMRSLRLLSRAALSTNARKTGTGSHPTTRQPSRAA